jgi:hypothetical protein
MDAADLVSFSSLVTWGLICHRVAITAVLRVQRSTHTFLEVAPPPKSGGDQLLVQTSSQTLLEPLEAPSSNDQPNRGARGLCSVQRSSHRRIIRWKQRTGGVPATTRTSMVHHCVRACPVSPSA